MNNIMTAKVCSDVILVFAEHYFDISTVYILNAYQSFD